MPAYRIARMGVVHVPEGRGIFPSLDVRENLEMAADGTHGRGNGADSGGSAIDEATEMFPVLGNRLRQTAGSLSGGEQQMLALARAIMARPRLLMVDEISMGLAPIVVGHLFEALRKIAATGASLLLVEQYVETALELADYVYVMDKGVIVDVGEPNDMRVQQPGCGVPGWRGMTRGARSAARRMGGAPLAAGTGPAAADRCGRDGPAGRVGRRRHLARGVQRLGVGHRRAVRLQRAGRGAPAQREPHRG